MQHTTHTLVRQHTATAYCVMYTKYSTYIDIHISGSQLQSWLLIASVYAQCTLLWHCPLLHGWQCAAHSPSPLPPRPPRPLVPLSTTDSTTYHCHLCSVGCGRSV